MLFRVSSRKTNKPYVRYISTDINQITTLNNDSLTITLPQKHENLRSSRSKAQQPQYKSSAFRINALKTKRKEKSNSVQLQVQETPYNYNTIQLLEIIKQGSQNQIFMAKLSDNVAYIVVKKIKIQSQSQKRHCKLIKKLKSPFIIERIGNYYSNDSEGNSFYNVLMPKYTENLKQNIESKPKLSEKLLKIYIYQLVRGILYLHSKGICHRNLNSENVLVKKYCIALSGLSSVKRISQISQNDGLCNQYQYLAPQLLSGVAQHSYASDIWALGCLICFILLRNPLFDGFNQADQLVRISRVLGTPNWKFVSWVNTPEFYSKLPKFKKVQLESLFPSKTSSQLLNLLSKILVWQPKDRPNVFQILSDQFFSELRDENRYNDIKEQVTGLPSLFEFEGGEFRGNEQYLKRLIPVWMRMRYLQKQVSR